MSCIITHRWERTTFDAATSPDNDFDVGQKSLRNKGGTTPPQRYGSPACEVPIALVHWDLWTHYCDHLSGHLHDYPCTAPYLVFFKSTVNDSICDRAIPNCRTVVTCLVSMPLARLCPHQIHVTRWDGVLRQAQHRCFNYGRTVRTIEKFIQLYRTQARTHWYETTTDQRFWIRLSQDQQVCYDSAGRIHGIRSTAWSFVTLWCSLPWEASLYTRLRKACKNAVFNAAKK